MSWHQAIKIAKWTALVSGVFYIVTFVILAACTSLQSAVHFDGYGADGPFQIYNPLRRLAAGEVTGRDFQFFHGIGIPLLHYPLFRLLGSNILASEFTRQILGVAAFLVSALIFFQAALRNWRKSILATSLILLLFTVFAKPLFTEFSLIYPTNSLLGLRTTVPLLFASLYMLDIKKRWGVRGIEVPAGQVLLGLVAAIALLFGTEQGMAIALAYAFITLLAGRKAIKRSLVSVGWFAASCAASLLGLLTVITAGHPLVPLKYSLIEVSGDQAWYFGTAPNTFFTWSNIWPLLTPPFMLQAYAFMTILIVTLLVLRRFKLILNHTALVGLLLITYGILAFVVPSIGGYFGTGQIIPLLRCALTMLVLLVVLLMVKAAQALSQAKHLSRRIMVLAGAVLLLTATFVGLGLYAGTNNLYLAKHTHPIQLLRAAKHAWYADDYQDVSDYWKYRLDTFNSVTKGSHSVWSIYAGLYESQAGMLQPSSIGSDYIIHALGPERRASYEQQFIESKPEYAITLRQSYFPYEEWLWMRHWKLYRHLLQNYSIVKANDSHFLWRRVDQPSVSGAWQQARVDKNGEVSLDPQGSGQGRVFEVKVDYNATPGLSFVRSLPRYQIKIENSALHIGAVLPPYESSWEFPISYFGDGRAITLTPSVQGLFPGALQIKRVWYREVAMSDASRGTFMDAGCFSYDKGWTASPACSAFLKTKY